LPRARAAPSPRESGAIRPGQQRGDEIAEGLDPGRRMLAVRIDQPQRRADMTFVADMIIDCNLGMPFLKNVLLTLDLGAGRAWIAAAQ
jgi:hypothetical protein